MNIMKNPKYVLFIAVFGLVVLIFVFSWFFTKSTVEFTTASNVTQATFRLNNDSYSQAYSVPSTLSLKPGKYTVKASNPGSEIFVLDFTVWPLFNRSVDLVYKDSEHPNYDSAESLTYIRSFPHYGENFSAELVINFDTKKETVVIKPYIVPVNNETKEQIESMKNEYVTEAKNWLKSVGVPDSVEIVIDSQY